MCHSSGTFTSGSFKGMPLTSATVRVTYTHTASDNGKCNTCHLGSTGYAEGVSSTPGNTHLGIPLVGGVAVNCDTCHKSTTNWTGIKTNPVRVSYTHTVSDQNNCSSCHTGSTDSNPVQHGGAIGTGYFASHIAVNGSDCKTCHQASLPNYTSFAGGTATDHRTVADCTSCHYNSTTNTLQFVTTNPTYKHFSLIKSAGGVANVRLVMELVSQLMPMEISNSSSGLLWWSLP